MQKRIGGFALIEIAIVLVIIGLLLGGVVKGQELISSARVSSVISQQEGIKAAFFGFQDRYRALPGDYAAASIHINCGGCANGNSNGYVEAPNALGLHEDILAWHHMSASGFLAGSYAMSDSGTSIPDGGNTPKNTYLMYLHFAYDGIYGTGTTGSPAAPRHNLKTGTLLPVELLAEVDRKIDDGKAFEGAFRFSAYTPAGGATPMAGTCTATGNWNIQSGETNCGASSLL